MKGKKYTIKDIADLASVSKGTVDRVLHNRGKVSEKALNAINAVLKDIDYEPNILARNLKINKVYQICVLLPDPNEDKYWMPCVEGVEQAITEFKSLGVYIETFYFDPNSTDSFLKINKTIIKLSPDATLLTPFFLKETLQVVEKYAESDILVSAFNDQINSSYIKGYVGQNLFQSGRTSAKLMNMITLNKTKLVIIHIDEAFNNAIHLQEKEKGFRDYFDQKSPTNYDIITLKVDSEDFEENFIAFLNENLDISGIFVTTSKSFMLGKVIEKIAHKTIKLIGYDLLDENIYYLKNGIIDFLIYQNPKLQTFLGVRYLVEHFLFNKVIPNQRLLSIDIVNSENLASFLEN